MRKLRIKETRREEKCERRTENRDGESVSALSCRLTVTGQLFMRGVCVCVCVCVCTHWITVSHQTIATPPLLSWLERQERERHEGRMSKLTGKQ